MIGIELSYVEFCCRRGTLLIGNTSTNNVSADVSADALADGHSSIHGNFRTNFNIISSTISDTNSTARSKFSSDTLAIIERANATAHEFESDTNETTNISANNGWPNTKAYDSTNISAT